MRYTLKPLSERNDSKMYGVYSKGKIVGRVVPHAEGGFVGVMNGGKTKARGSDPTSTFYELIAVKDGFKNLAERNDFVEKKNVEIRAHNKKVRARRAEMKRDVQHAINEFQIGNYTAFGDLFDKYS